MFNYPLMVLLQSEQLTTWGHQRCCIHICLRNYRNYPPDSSQLLKHLTVSHFS